MNPRNRINLDEHSCNSSQRNSGMSSLRAGDSLHLSEIDPNSENISSVDVSNRWSIPEYGPFNIHPPHEWFDNSSTLVPHRQSLGTSVSESNQISSEFIQENMYSEPGLSNLARNSADSTSLPAELNMVANRDVVLNPASSHSGSLIFYSAESISGPNAGVFENTTQDAGRTREEPVRELSPSSEPSEQTETDPVGPLPNLTRRSTWGAGDSTLASRSKWSAKRSVVQFGQLKPESSQSGSLKFYSAEDGLDSNKRPVSKRDTTYYLRNPREVGELSISQMEPIQEEISRLMKHLVEARNKIESIEKATQTDDSELTQLHSNSNIELSREACFHNPTNSTDRVLKLYEDKQYHSIESSSQPQPFGSQLTTAKMDDETVTDETDFKKRQYHDTISTISQNSPKTKALSQECLQVQQFILPFLAVIFACQLLMLILLVVFLVK